MTTQTGAPSRAHPTATGVVPGHRARADEEASLAGEVGQSLVLLVLAAAAAGSALGAHSLLQALS